MTSWMDGSLSQRDRTLRRCRFRGLPASAWWFLLAVMVFGAPGAGPAAGQRPLICSNAADALETSFRAERLVAGAPLRVVVARKAGRVAEVSGLVVEVVPGSGPVPAAVPGPGTLSETMLALPARNGRAVVRISWLQSPEPGVSDGCRGIDARTLSVGPSARQLRAYLTRVGAAQRLWFAHNRRQSAVLKSLADAIPKGQTDAQVVLTGVRRAGRVALSRYRARVRPLLVRYRARLRAIRPPGSLSTVHDELRRSADVDLRADAVCLTAFATAQSLSDTARANRASSRAGDRIGSLRSDWRVAIAKASREARLRPPAWVMRVGR